MSPCLPNTLSFDECGGAKVNYSDPVNNSTDWSADNLNVAFATASQASVTAVRAQVVFTSSASPSLVSWNAVWKAYNQPPVIPVITNSTTGIFVVSFPSSVLDPLGNTLNVNLKDFQVSIEGSSFGLVQAKITAANQVTVYVASIAGSLSNLGLNIHVWVA